MRSVLWLQVVQHTAGFGPIGLELYETVVNKRCDRTRPSKRTGNRSGHFCLPFPASTARRLAREFASQARRKIFRLGFQAIDDNKVITRILAVLAIIKLGIGFLGHCGSVSRGPVGRLAPQDDSADLFTQGPTASEVARFGGGLRQSGQDCEFFGIAS